MKHGRQGENQAGKGLAGLVPGGQDGPHGSGAAGDEDPGETNIGPSTTLSSSEIKSYSSSILRTYHSNRPH